MLVSRVLTDGFLIFNRTIQLVLAIIPNRPEILHLDLLQVDLS